MKNGNLSINSENIFPVIKKWLYSDHDIFVRELISNGCDAVTKLKKLSLMGEFDEPDEPYRIDVTTSANDKTITFTDNGIGMTEEEVEKYINQIAFSGAEAFLEQYKDKATEEQIIATSDWASTPHSWLPTRSPSRQSHTRTARTLYTGSARTALNTP